MTKVDHDGRIMLLLKMIKMMTARTITMMKMNMKMKMKMQTMKIMMMKIMVW